MMICYTHFEQIKQRDFGQIKQHESSIFYIKDKSVQWKDARRYIT